jgi:hypothetical protein
MMCVHHCHRCYFRIATIIIILLIIIIITGHHTSLFYRDGSCTVTNTFMLFLNSAILPNEAYDNWRRIQHYIHTSKSSVETPTMKDDEIQRLFEAAQWSLTNFNVDPKCQRCSGCRKEHSELKSEYLTPDGKLRIMPVRYALNPFYSSRHI